MATRIRPTTPEGKARDQKALLRPAKADTLLTELDADIQALGSVQDNAAKEILRHLLQRQRVILKRISDED